MTNSENATIYSNEDMFQFSGLEEEIRKVNSKEIRVAAPENFGSLSSKKAEDTE